MNADRNSEAAERFFRAFERWDLRMVESLVTTADYYFANPFEAPENRRPFTAS